MLLQLSPKIMKVLCIKIFSTPLIAKVQIHHKEPV